MKKKTELSENEKLLCDEFRSCRKLAGKTQEEFAKETGIAIATVKNIERYKTKVSIRTQTLVNRYLRQQDIVPTWDRINEYDEAFTLAKRYLPPDTPEEDIQKISEYLKEILSFKRPAEKEYGDKYVEFLSVTLQQYRDICSAEKITIKRDSHSALKQEIDSFARIARIAAKQINKYEDDK